MTEAETPETTKIVLIEDDLTYAHILTNSLKEEADFRVLGCFHSVEEALEASCSWEDADCALIDLELPGASGNQLVRHLSKVQPAMKTIVLTAYQDSHAALQAIQYGAQGYIMKDLPLREILRELRSLRSGGTPLDPRAAKVLMTHLRLDQEKDSIAVFSKRETEILRFISSGLQYKEVADRLNISPHTVHSHIKRIYRRLQVRDRRGALQKVRLLGIIEQ